MENFDIPMLQLIRTIEWNILRYFPVDGKGRVLFYCILIHFFVLEILCFLSFIDCLFWFFGH